MAYSVYPITSISDIPSLVASFANALGFTTATLSATSITVKHPTYVGARVFGVQIETGGAHPAASYQDVIVNCNGSDGTFARARSPKLNPSQGNTDGSVILVQPTKLHLIGNLDGGPSDAGISFVAGVIEYGFNLYRHFYLGYIEKITAFNGGELITGSNCWYSNLSVIPGASYSRSYDDYREMVYPFSANNGAAWLNNGGAYISHANNSQTWREFATRSDFVITGIHNTFAANGHKIIMGGFKDALNTGYAAAGKAPYSGVDVLASINLYIGKRAAGTQYLQAVGRAAGARLVHMEDLEPGDEITVGTSVWRVFPVFAKSPTQTMGGTGGPSTGRAWPMNNTSHYVGMAYRVSA